MSKGPIFIVGAGGHSKVATEIIESADWEIIAYIDEGTKLNEFLQRPVYASLEQAEKHHPTVKNAFVAIGANESREKWYNLLIKSNYNTPYFTHSTAWISSTAKIEAGALILGCPRSS